MKASRLAKRLSVSALLAAGLIAVALACGGKQAGEVAVPVDLKGLPQLATGECGTGVSYRTRLLALGRKQTTHPTFKLAVVSDHARPDGTYVTGTESEPERLYVLSQPGRVTVLEDGKPREEPFLDLTSKVRFLVEEGLLSLAFHPDYEDNHRFFVYYNDVQGNINIVEYRSDGERAIASSARPLVHIDKTDDVYWHNGGQLEFGPDGMLYFATGDSAHSPLDDPPAPSTDPNNQAQDPGTMFGKLFRLDVDREGAKPEVIAYGLRNPWRFSFDPETNDMYIADVGFHRWEEIDFYPHDEKRVLNFGWSVCEGAKPFVDVDAGAKKPDPRRHFLGDGAVTPPIAQYRHPSVHYCGDRGSITGGYVYRGEDIPALRGRYVFADYCTGEVWSAPVEGHKFGAVQTEVARGKEARPLTSFGRDGRGELYLVDATRVLYKLVAADDEK